MHAYYLLNKLLYLLCMHNKLVCILHRKKLKDKYSYSWIHLQKNKP